MPGACRRYGIKSTCAGGSPLPSREPLRGTTIDRAPVAGGKTAPVERGAGDPAFPGCSTLLHCPLESSPWSHTPPSGLPTLTWGGSGRPGGLCSPDIFGPSAKANPAAPPF